MTADDLKAIKAELRAAFEPYRYDEELASLAGEDLWSIVLIYEIRQLRKAIEEKQNVGRQPEEAGSGEVQLEQGAVIDDAAPSDGP